MIETCSAVVLKSLQPFYDHMMMHVAWKIIVRQKAGQLLYSMLGERFIGDSGMLFVCHIWRFKRTQVIPMNILQKEH